MSVLFAPTTISENQGLSANAKCKDISDTSKRVDTKKLKGIGKQGSRRPLGDMSNGQRTVQPASSGMMEIKKLKLEMPPVERMPSAELSKPSSFDASGIDLEHVVQAVSARRSATFGAPYDCGCSSAIDSCVVFEVPLSPSFNSAPPPTPISVMQNVASKSHASIHSHALAQAGGEMPSPQVLISSMQQRNASPLPYLEMGLMVPVGSEPLDAEIARLDISASEQRRGPLCEDLKSPNHDASHFATEVQYSTCFQDPYGGSSLSHADFMERIEVDMDLEGD